MAAPTTCAPCDCLSTLPQLANSEASYRAATLSILCGILAEGGGGSGSNVTVINGAGAAAVNIQDGGNSITVDDGGTSLTVDGSVTVSNGAAGAAVNIQDGGNSITVDGAVTISSGSVTVSNAAGASAVNIQDGGNTITVDGAVTVSSGSVTVSNAGGGSAVNIQDGGNTITVDGAVTVSSGTVAAAGTVADDATTPGNPVMIGGKAVQTDGTDPTSVSAEDDVAIARTDMNRRLLVNTFHPNLWSATDNQSSAQTNKSLKTAPASGLSLYITDIIVSNGATAGSLRFVSDTAGTPVIQINELYLGVNTGVCKNFATPIRIPTATNFGYTSTTVTTHTVFVSGFIAP